MSSRLAGRRVLVTGAEGSMGPAIAAFFLASDRSNFFDGQVFPFAGGSALST
jgi:FlaA1/EpsC-like NDP-sugar epimerase